MIFNVIFLLYFNCKLVKIIYIFDENDYFHYHKNVSKLARGSYCFACAYADEVFDLLFGDSSNSSLCDFCPLKTSNKNYCLGGLYRQYTLAKNNIERSYYAKKIRDLPLNPIFNFKDVVEKTNKSV